MSASFLAHERELFHKRLLECGLLSLDGEVASNADTGSRASKEIGLRLARLLDAPQGKKLTGQTSGTAFEHEVADYVRRTFREMQHLRPGSWEVRCLGNRGHRIAEGFVQYEHLGHLADLVARDHELRMALGNDYVVSPDIVVFRERITDEDINSSSIIVDNDVARASDLRVACGETPILHASISAKWTIRSDRAQNSRTEALNLIRNRKGHLPHIVVVTGEPLPSRLSSLALGTGDIDCVYHVALYELEKAAADYAVTCGKEACLDELQGLIVGRRLKDISDLPLDLCV